ncbi:hypothetical protein BD626DRAFT_499161 [Schizophyllum amplum]|uniref:Uncharacterized protein n=1 Tax=Schizophyllum amplum TaxID=97359 RepID=A0A550CCJ8_9AGAR|nr:hypothetical protein BD626DRAFT_499161 [Auriculariopsis ampla]
MTSPERAGKDVTGARPAFPERVSAPSFPEMANKAISRTVGAAACPPPLWSQ